MVPACSGLTGSFRMCERGAKAGTAVRAGVSGVDGEAVEVVAVAGDLVHVKSVNAGV